MARPKLSEDARALKREDILDAAMTVFEQQGGLESLSFRKLAVEMGLSYSASYRYFANKAELVDALRARAFRWIEQAMIKEIDTSTSPDEQLNALAAAYINAGVERPARYALMFFELKEQDQSSRSLELKAAKRDALDVCTQVIAAGQASGAFPVTMDPLTAAHLFWIGAHGVVSLQVSGQFVMGRNPKILVPMLVRTLRQGMEHYNSESSALTSSVELKEIKHGR